MIVKLLEHYQDARMHLYPDTEAEVDAALGNWLIENKKAVLVVKHLDVEPQFEQTEEPPVIPHVEKPPRRSRRS